MRSPATDIAEIINDSGLGTIGVDIFVGSDQPPQPDTAIFVQRTGITESNSPNSNLGYQYPTVQVIVRAGKGERQKGDLLVEEVQKVLHGLTDIRVYDSLYVYVFLLSGPFDLAQDQVMRPLTSLNFDMMRKQVAELLVGTCNQHSSSDEGPLTEYTFIRSAETLLQWTSISVIMTTNLFHSSHVITLSSTSSKITETVCLRSTAIQLNKANSNLTKWTYILSNAVNESSIAARLTGRIPAGQGTSENRSSTSADLTETT